MAVSVLIPKGEEAWVYGYAKSGELMYIVTSKKGVRPPFYIYRVDGKDCKKLGSGKNPTALEDKYFWHGGAKE